MQSLAINHRPGNVTAVCGKNKDRIYVDSVLFHMNQVAPSEGHAESLMIHYQEISRLNDSNRSDSFPSQMRSPLKSNIVLRRLPVT